MRTLPLLPLLLPCLPAQDPTPPPGGFDVLVSTHQITWSDGYRTMMDVYVPDAPAPASGWPGVLAVHGGAGQRTISYVVQAGNRLAAAGYVVYAYDVRGNSVSSAMNPGFPPDHTLMLRDAAESHAAADLAAGGIVDETRLAVTGFSQGCVHAFEAAAWSGKQIPPHYTTTYPPIVAVYGRGHSPDRVGSTVPNGRMVKAKTAVELHQSQPAWFAMIQAGDYAGLEAAMLADPQIDFFTELQTSSVAIFAQPLWHDSKQVVNPILDGLNALPPTTPWRALLSTDGHDTPGNQTEILRKHELRRQWFDFHLKGIQNGIDRAPRIEAALFPSEPGAFQSTQSHWPHRYAAQWPPALPTSTYYLRANAGLSPTPPPAIETGPVVHNAPVPGYDEIDFCLANGWQAVQNTRSNLPLSRASFDLQPAPNPIEIFGRPRVRLWVDATIGDFQVSAALYKVAPNGAEMFLGVGTDAVRGQAAGRHRLDIDVMDMGVTLAAGDRVRVVIENLALHEPPGHERIRILPEFTSYDLTVVMEPGFASRLELPVTVRRPQMTPAIAERTLGSAGFGHTLSIASSPQHAGHDYLAVLGVTGSWPGTPLGAATLPVNWDVFSDVGLTLAFLANPWWTGAFGQLDAQGRAQVQLNLDPIVGQLFAGARLTFSAIVYDPATASYAATTACELLVAP